MTQKTQFEIRHFAILPTNFSLVWLKTGSHCVLRGAEEGQGNRAKTSR